MAGNRKPPTLRRDGKYYVVGIYKPNGQRTNISFGTQGIRTEGEIYTEFGKWLDLYNQHPLKVLSFTSPYDAIEQITNPVNVVNVGELLDKYEEDYGLQKEDSGEGYNFGVSINHGKCV